MTARPDDLLRRDVVTGWALVCNHAHRRMIREGAKCYVVPWGVDYAESTQIVVLAGRWIQMWTRTHRLSNYRVQRVEVRKGSKVAEHCLFGDAEVERWRARAEAMNAPKEPKPAPPR